MSGGKAENTVWEQGALGALFDTPPTMAELKELLDAEAERINSPAFIADDPVQFPRRFSSQPDIEITSLLVSAIAWGNRRMICRDCSRLLELMQGEPYRYMMDGAWQELPDEGNIHRTFFNRHLKYFMRGLRHIYTSHPTLEHLAIASGTPAAEMAPWHLAGCINAMLASANEGIAPQSLASRCLPQNLATTALKRLNMALRWLVRDDGIVDMGVWNALRPAQLYIPLDVHVGNVSRQLGLLTRRSDDRRAVAELTGALRSMRPHDPAVYDYALFGIGMKL